MNILEPYSATKKAFDKRTCTYVLKPSMRLACSKKTIRSRESSEKPGTEFASLTRTALICTGLQPVRSRNDRHPHRILFRHHSPRSNQLHGRKDLQTRWKACSSPTATSTTAVDRAYTNFLPSVHYFQLPLGAIDCFTYSRASAKWVCYDDIVNTNISVWVPGPPWSLECPPDQVDQQGKISAYRPPKCLRWGQRPLQEQVAFFFCYRAVHGALWALQTLGSSPHFHLIFSLTSCTDLPEAHLG